MTMLDRRAEADALGRLLAAVRDGLSGILVLRGEAGIGKTELLEHAVALAADMRVARVVAVESEMELGFAGLHQLLVPFLAGIDRLPAPQREALGSAFGLLDGPAPDRFLVGLAVLTLLTDATAARPLLCVVDDAQWLDRASAAALAFVARRLLADRIAILFGVREPADRPDPLEGLPELRVSGLPDPEARELLASAAGGRMDQRVADRLVSDTGGNPLALVELAGALTPAELSGGSRLPEPLPIGSRLEARFLARARALSAEAQTLMLIAAAEPAGDAALLWRAAEVLGVGPEVMDVAAVDRLLAFTPRLAFRHPLMRSAVYRGASPTARRRVHAALAAASDRELDADRRAWHLAAAVIGPDEQVAAELVRSADSARARGGYAAAARFLVRAAELTPDDEPRARRRLYAAQAELAGGIPAVAGELLEQARPQLSDPLDRAEAKRLEARIRFALGEGGVVAPMLLEAAQAMMPVDLARARAVLMEALDASLYAGRFAGEARTPAVARAIRATPLPAATPPSATDLLLDAVAQLDQGYPAGARQIKLALVAGREGAELPELGQLAAAELRDDASLQWLTDRWLQRARDRGDIMAMLPGLGYKVLSEVLAGRLPDAELALLEGRGLAAATGNVGVFGSRGLIGLWLLTWRGREGESREAAAAIMREMTERRMGGQVNSVRACMTILELGHCNYEAAAELAGVVFEEDPFYLGTAILPNLIEAAARSDQVALAATALERLSERSLASGSELALGLLARARALLARGEEAERHYRLAVGHTERSVTAPEAARARLLYGEWLRRERRRADAREQLRIAHESFDFMGLEAFAERARVELLATGEHARARGVETRDQLTPQEAQIARLAAEGATNREIAAQLFISPATVAYHLQKVFRKLDVSSRTGLQRALGERGKDE
jgi:DNA-binding CsgD family transcriptional regulator